MTSKREDTDGDGLSDVEELEIGTDPYDVDTDADGWADADELDWGTNPLDPDSNPES